MNDAVFHQKLKEAENKIAQLPPEQQSVLNQLLSETRERHEQIKQSMARAQEALNDWRLHNKYLLFDLEATKRELAQLRKKLGGSGNQQ